MLFPYIFADFLLYGLCTTIPQKWYDRLKTIKFLVNLEGKTESKTSNNNEVFQKLQL